MNYSAFHILYCRAKACCCTDTPPKFTRWKFILQERTIIKNRVPYFLQAVNNTIGHAQAKHIKSNLQIIDNYLTLEVVNNGIGIDKIHQYKKDIRLIRNKRMHLYFGRQICICL